MCIRDSHPAQGEQQFGRSRKAQGGIHFHFLDIKIGLEMCIRDRAKDRAHLKTLLKVASGGVVFTTIQKFYPEEGNLYEELSDRKNIIVIADEAHRTQYGFHAKTIDDLDADVYKRQR